MTEARCGMPAAFAWIILGIGIACLVGAAFIVAALGGLI